jgi:hypothetical protein
LYKTLETLPFQWMVWIRLIWLGVRISGGLLWTWTLSNVWTRIFGGQLWPRLHTEGELYLLTFLVTRNTQKNSAYMSHTPSRNGTRDSGIQSSPKMFCENLSTTLKANRGDRYTHRHDNSTVVYSF